MVTSGGFGGGPSLPMSGDFGSVIGVIALLAILGLLYLVITRVVEF
jgi:hypothetical protein